MSILELQNVEKTYGEKENQEENTHEEQEKQDEKMAVQNTEN